MKSKIKDEIGKMKNEKGKNKISQFSFLISQFRIRRSFTLIELLIVVAVIALLAMMVSGNYFTSLKRGRDAKRKSDLHAMQNALEQCFTVNNSTYPTITTSNGAKTVSETCPDASLSLSFTDPSTRTYTVVTSGTAYSISTTSEYDGSTISVSNLQ